jgi:hypothetical protein
VINFNDAGAATPEAFLFAIDVSSTRTQNRFAVLEAGS